ncbi:MAG: PLD nuclease N-terminal domain-containing protein [Polyangiaceae bacterium]
MNDNFGGNIPPYAYVLLAFSLWMLVDAARRRAPSYWYFVILFLPFGAVIYFLFVKLRDARTESDEASRGRSSSSPSNPLLDLGRSTDAAPSLAQADQLEENERYEEAESIFRRAIAREPENLQALHGLGRSLLGLGRARESLEYFEHLLELDRSYRNYGAALDYADALWDAGQKMDTIELLEQLAAHTKRINHRLALAHYIGELGQKTRAAAEVRAAIDDEQVRPDASSERSRRWIERARAMLAAFEARDANEDASHLH